MSYRGHIKNGIVVFDEPADLPEGTEVRVETISTVVNRPESIEHVSTACERLKPLVGVIKDMPSDMSINHDHYLYGTPKRQ